MVIQRILSQPLHAPDLSRLKTLDWPRIAFYAPFIYFLWLALPLFSVAAKVDQDSEVYLRMARGDMPLFGALRPATVAVVYKALGANAWLIGTVQLLCALAAWSLLAVAVARSIRSVWLRPVAVLLVLLFSLCVPISQWHRLILSESISMSLWALTLAGSLWLIESWSRPKAAALVAVIALWVFSRDTNAYMVAPVGAALVLAYFKLGRGYAKLGAACILIALLSLKDADRGQRWLFPFYNSLGHRILVDGKAVDYFKAHGMPVSAHLLSRAGTWASEGKYYFYKAKEMEPLRQWTATDGKRTYAKWMLSDRQRFISEPAAVPWLVFGTLAPKRYQFYYKRQDSRRILEWEHEDRLFTDGLRLLQWWSVAVVGGMALLYRFRRAWWLVPLVMLAAVYPLAWLCYWGDPMEIPRHCLLAGVMWRLALWVGTMAVLDAVYQRLTSRSRTTRLEAGSMVAGPTNQRDSTLELVG